MTEAKSETPDEKDDDKTAAAGGQASGEGNDDEAASRVAEALGVGSEEAVDAEGEGSDAAAAEGEEEKPAPNRAARRRDEAQRRKKRGTGDLPADKNARAKELLQRRREEAEEGSRGKADVGSNLLASELVDDALARTASATSRWIKANFNVLQWVVLAAIVGTAGFLVFRSRTESNQGLASHLLGEAIAAEEGRVMEEDKRDPEEKEADPTRIFKTPEERNAAAKAAYEKAAAEKADGASNLLAKLGLGGVALDRKDWQGAIDAYGAVLGSPLAQADADVKARALEGLGYAKEGKGDVDGALTAFKDLEGVEGRPFKELGQYHQARLLAAKGEPEKAKDLLKQAREKLTAPSAEGRPFGALEAMVDELLRKLDPAAVPARPMQLGGAKGGNMTPEEIQELLRKAQERAAQKGGEKGADPH